MPENKNKRVYEPKVAQLLLDECEGSGLPDLKPGDLLRPAVKPPIPTTSFFDTSFKLEEKEFPFAVENESFYSEATNAPFQDYSIPTVRTESKIIYTDSSQFVTPPRKKPRAMVFNSPQLLDPDESIDLETCTLRKHRGASRTKIPIVGLPPSSTIGPTEFPYFPGFKTALGQAVVVQEDSLIKARRSLDFLQPAQVKQPPKVLLPRERMILSAQAAFHAMQKEIFPVTRTAADFHSLFCTFQWTWISLMPVIESIRRRDSDMAQREIEDLIIREAKRRWKQNHPSILQRIVERDTQPGVYMKLLVIKEGRNSIWVTDGLYSVRAALDPHLVAIARKIKVGRVLQVIGATLLLPGPTPIDEVAAQETIAIQLNYNGVKPCLSGVLGYQPCSAYLRSVSFFKPQSGTVGCVSLYFAKLVCSKCVINLNGSKTTIDESRREETLETVYASIKKRCLSKEEEQEVYRTISVTRFVQYEVTTDYNPSNIPIYLTIWQPPKDEDFLHKRFEVFVLNTSSYAPNSKALFLTSTRYSVFIPIIDPPPNPYETVIHSKYYK
ncbi:hypothetical protein NEHOM01_1386 [Nematocida homosporus]|uniref:uncharacterized protein n=1 Tax=Nematocida homosporus TaxID=1912981 RepID=UPI0022203A1E|nr:uncharacterized protein NEHOM01_1386 [Nematocida homosporus]KAI5186322.1 hypothetical protein NEHOM01_1386 [Nematocida homosporus]